MSIIPQVQKKGKKYHFKAIKCNVDYLDRLGQSEKMRR